MKAPYWKTFEPWFTRLWISLYIGGIEQSAANVVVTKEDAKSKVEKSSFVITSKY